MKDKIAFIAVGQAGGNIGQLFESMGYTVLYINTSREDLETLENAKFRYHVSNGEGCNKDRHKAKQLIVEDFDNITAGQAPFCDFCEWRRHGIRCGTYADRSTA